MVKPNVDLARVAGGAWQALRPLGAKEAFVPKGDRLWKAVLDDDAPTILSLVAGGESPDLELEPGLSPLFAAYNLGRDKALAALLRAGVDLEAEAQDGATVLLLAASQGNTAIAKMLIGAGADPNHGVRSGQTPLMMAVLSKASGIVDALLDAGADVRDRDNEGFDALAVALEEECEAISRRLLEAGAEPNPLGVFVTPLMHASRSGMLSMVEALLARGADPDFVGKEGMTALSLAAAGGHGAVLERLVAAGVDPRKGDQGRHPVLMAAVASRNAEVVERALRLGANPNPRPAKDGVTPLALAMRLLPEATVRAMVSAGADPRARIGQGDPLIVLAAQYGLAGLLLDFLAAGIPVDELDAHDGTALHAAAASGQLRCVEVLLEAGADPNLRDKDGLSPMASLLVAWIDPELDAEDEPDPGSRTARIGDACRVLDLLLAAGSDLQAQDSLGATLLHLAVMSGEPLFVERLLEAGADPAVAPDRYGCSAAALAAEDAGAELLTFFLDRGLSPGHADPSGETLLYSAVRAASLPCARLLAERGATLDTVDSARRSLLHAAAESRSRGILAWCLGRGLDPNAPDEAGRTALHTAVLAGDVEAVRVLRASSADSSRKDVSGRTPLDLARKSGQKAMLRALK